MGGGGSKKKKTNFADKQGELALQLFQQTDPLRQLLLGQSANFLRGGADVTETPAYQDLQLQSGQNFNQAKDNMIARFAPGGGLVDALSGLEGDRASVLSQGAAGIHESELNRALALGTGATGLSLGSLGQAGQVQAARAQAKADEKGGVAGGLGAAAGGFLGGK